MAVVLSVLKWIGIVLGCLILGILALALLILLVVLFVPFRYQATVATDETGKKKVLYGFGITWILHAVSVRKNVDSDQIVIRILGIPVKRMGGEPADDGRDKSRPEDAEETEESVAYDMPDSTDRMTESIGEDSEEIVKSSDESSGELSEESEKNQSEETLIETSDDFSEDETEKEKTEVENDISDEETEDKLPFPTRLIQSVRDRIQDIRQKIQDIRQKIRHTFKKIGFIFYKLSSIIDFVKDRATRQTVKKLTKEAVGAIRYVGPKKISGTLEFGTGDPYSTGLILAGVSLCKLAYKKDVTITPNFEEKCLAGDCTVSGRIRVVYFVRMALRIWFNKDVHHLWKRYRQMKKDFRRESRSRGLDKAA